MKSGIINEELSSNLENVEAISLNEVIEELISGLKSRPKDILVRRFGLGGGSPEVLDRIGKEFGVTRERIRQIENDSFKKIQGLNKSQNFDNIIDQAVRIISEKGSFCEKSLLKETLKPGLSGIERNQLMFILNCCTKIKFRKGNLELAGFWFLGKDFKESDIIQSHKFIVKYLKEKRTPFKFDELLNYLRSSSWQKFFSDDSGSKRLEMLLRLSKIVERNILGQWGIRNWRLISERGTREKAYLILKKQKKPLHFREITVFINKHWDKREALSQTVHNELIKDRRFILLGRGIYGLHEWGYPEGTVKEVIINFLQDRAIPQPKEEIVKFVLSKRKVKKTTILVNLADRRVFIRDMNGNFRVQL